MTFAFHMLTKDKTTSFGRGILSGWAHVTCSTYNSAKNCVLESCC